MKASNAVTTHAAGTVTTLATGWKVTLRDGTVLGFTTHIEDQVIAGVTYQTLGGGTPTAIQTSAGLEPDTLQVLGVLVSPQIINTDLRAGRWDYAAVELFLYNYKDLSATLLLRKGTLGQVRMGKVRFEAELEGLTAKLQRTIGRVVGPCNADLGDPRCGIDLGVFADGTVAGSVTAVTSQRQFADAGLTQPTGWFDGGVVTFTGGLNTGYAREVKTYNATGDIVVLQDAFPYAIALADTYEITAGCDKGWTTCGTKFANRVNHRGFPHVPGMDRMVTGT